MKKILLTSMCAFLIGSFAFAQKSQIDLPITWDDSANVDYTVADFDGTSSSLAADPMNSTNTVLKTVKNAGQVWAGTTMSTTSGLANKIPFAAGSLTMKAIVYSPDTGITIKLKVENAQTGTINAEVDVKTTVANAWDTLTFNFSNPTAGSINLCATYEKVTIFYDFGTMGTGKTYYVDNVWFASTGNPPPAKAQIELPITWNDSANVDYTVSDFDGTSSSLAADPSNSNNTVLRTVKNAGQVWAGTTLSTPCGLAKFIPFTAGDQTLKAIVYSPDTGITVKLKVENSSVGTINSEVDVKTTVASAWDTLTFDFHNANNAIDTTKTYGKVTIFYDFGTMGSGKTYYVDNVWFVKAGSPPPPTKAQIDLPITWDDSANVDYAVSDFDGTSSSLSADPMNSANTVLKTVKNAGQVWAGTTLSRPNGLAKFIPFTAGDQTLKAIVYSPDTGITVKLKVENSSVGTINSEVDVKTTVANAWDTLTFDFHNGSNAIDTTKTYGKVTIFYDFGTMGSGKTYYVDNVWFVNAGSPPPPMKAQIDLPITWDDTANVDYKVSDFGGNASMMAADPMNASNLVLKSDKQANAQTWGGTTLSTPMGLKSAIPFTPSALTISAIVYSPDTGIVVRLKAEDKDTASISVETDVRTKVANGWDTLVFNFAVPALGTSPYDSTKVYDKLSIFYNFGVDGATAGAKTYYVDDVFFGGKAGGPPPPPDSSKVTFRLDMRGYPKDSIAYTTPEVNGTFNNWCGSCNAMTDADNDSIWEVTITTVLKTIEYKFSFDNWKGQERLDTTLTCTKTTGQFTNRIMNLNGDIVLPAVCWNSCLACPALSVNELSNTQTIKVYPNPASSTVNISGFDHVKSIRVTDVVGNVLMTVSDVYNTVEMPLENYNSGIYFIQVVEDNNNVQSLRFIKN